MKNETHQKYLLLMRETLAGGGASARKQLIVEMSDLVKVGELDPGDVYKIYFSVMPQIGT